MREFPDRRVTPPSRMVLTVAGSDPSGGAGIQADLKTFAAIGVYGGGAITSITVQNTRGVQSFQPLPAKLVAEQICAVLDDMPVTHIKTGMIGNGDIASAVGEALSCFTGEIVVDPVLVSSSGAGLLRPDSLAAFKSAIAGRATVLTPNLPELETLSGHPCRSEEDISAAAGELFTVLPKLRALAVKGGHFRQRADEVTDFLFLRESPARPETASHPRLATANTHGTGCTFASALAAFHLLCGDDRKAFRQASSFLYRLLEASADARFGGGHGPLLHHLFRTSELDTPLSSPARPSPQPED